MKGLAMEIIILLFAFFSKPDLAEFIQSDKTNEIQYTEGFNCRDYTAVFVENARAVGIDAFPIGAGFFIGENLVFHEFVGIQVDGEILWFEPQTDLFYIVNTEYLCYEDGECWDLAFIHYPIAYRTQKTSSQPAYIP
jgi:hypothetical protein